MSIYAGSLQVGNALGFIFGEVVSAALGWRWPYILEAIFTSFLAVLLLSAEKDPRLIQKHRPEGELEGGTVNSWSQQMCQLLRNSTYVWLCLGQAAFMFTAGAVAFWGTDFQVDHFGVSPLVAALVLGGIAVFAGLVATLLGSILADRLLKPTQNAFEKGEVSETALLARRTQIPCRMLTIAAISGACFGTGGAIANQYIVWVVTLAASVFSIALTNGPINLALLSCVRPELRGQAMAVQTFFYHLLGDFPSPYLVGWINQGLGMYWGYLITEAWLFLAALAWGVAWHRASRVFILVSLEEKLTKKSDSESII